MAKGWDGYAGPKSNKAATVGVLGYLGGGLLLFLILAFWIYIFVALGLMMVVGVVK